jgi:hypothetical protein
MPPPESRKAPGTPQDEPAAPKGPIVPPRPSTPQAGSQEPQKDDDGKPIVKPVTAGMVSSSNDEPDEPADEPRIDETVPGGRYQVGDKIVNAEGEVLGDAPAPKSTRKK